MPTYSPAPDSVKNLAAEILEFFETHEPVVEAGVTIDFMFAHGVDDKPAIMHGGYQAIGLCRIISLKDRVAGRSDVEITIDADWWQDANPGERRALLDHELHHISVPTDETDDAGRPVIKLRKHDVDVGWFSVIANRHGPESMERTQAQLIFDRHGQAFWPVLAMTASIGGAGTSSPRMAAVTKLTKGLRAVEAQKEREE